MRDEAAGRTSWSAIGRKPRRGGRGRGGLGLLVGVVEVDRWSEFGHGSLLHRAEGEAGDDVALHEQKMMSAGISVKIEIAAIVPHSVPVVVTYSERPVVMRAGVEARQRRGEQELVPGEDPGQDQA